MSDEEQPLLSAEELDAIQGLVEKGEFDDPGLDGDDAEWKAVSVVRTEEVLGASGIALSQINERFHRFFRNLLLTELDYNPRLSVATPTMMSYSEYLSTVASPASVNVIEVPPLKGEALILIHPQVIFSCVDNWYGGEARPLSVGEERGFTANESAVIDRMCALMFRSLQDAWQPYVETEVTLVNREVNPLFANIAADDETVVLNRFALRLPDDSVEPYIDLLYTFQSLNLQRDLLRSRIQTQDADQNWLERLNKSLDEVGFQLFVKGGTLDLALKEFEELEVGDVLSFDPPELAEVIVNEFPLFNAQVGTSGSKVAIRIVESALGSEG